MDEQEALTVTETEGDDLWTQLRAEFGPDFIIVFRPEDLSYFITSSSNSPICTERILKDIVDRMSKVPRTCDTCGLEPCRMLVGE